MKLHHIPFLCLSLSVPLVLHSTLFPVQIASAEPVFTDNIVQLLPGENASADGSSQATYYFLILDKEGQPINGLSGKSQLGKVKSTVRSEGNGIYSTTLTPEVVTTLTNEVLSISLDNSERVRIRERFTVQLTPALNRTFEISASPETITLGQDDFVTIKVQQTSGTTADSLRLSASTGTLDTLVNLGNGQYSARFTPPSKPYPHVAVFTLTDLENPENRSSFVLKQKGKTNFAVNSTPNSNVIIRIGERDFGPVQTDASGKASIPIIAPPGQSEATKIEITNGERSEELLDLRIPRNVPRFNIFPTLESMPADGFSTQTITFYVATLKGAPDTNAMLACNAKIGQCGDVKSIGNGYYQATYSAPSRSSKQTETIEAILQSASGDIVSTHTFDLLPILPETVEIKTAILELPKNTKEFKVTVRVRDGQNKGLDDRGLLVIGNGAKGKGAPRSLGSGDYSVVFTPSTDGPIEVTTAVKSTPSSNPATGIAMKANHPTLLNDGISSSLLSFAVYDSFGQPLANQPIELSVKGGGKLPSQTTTNSGGFAQVTYTAGTEPGIITITATSGKLSNDFVLLTGPQDMISNLNSLPRSQSQKHQRFQERIFNSVAHLRLDREGMEGVQLSGKIETIGAPENIGIKAEPSTVAPGGKTIIHMSVTDENSRGVDGEELTVMASSGQIGKVQNLGNGQYSVSLIAPNEGQETITVMASTLDGSVQSELQLTIVGGAESSSIVTDNNDTASSDDNTTVDAEPDKEPKQKKEPKPKKERTPRERTPRSTSSTPTWLRTSIGYNGGFYSYQQVPTSTTGLLYEKAITFNNQTEGSTPAGAFGLDVRGMGTIPNVSYLGYDLHIQADYYSVILEEFPTPIGDWITSIDAMASGQYPVEMSSFTVVPTVRLGLLRDDLMLYRQNILDDGNVELSYEPLFVTAPNVGFGAELQSNAGIFGHVYYDLGIRGSIYRKKLDARVGYDITDTVFVYTGGRSTVRTVDIEASSGKSGEIRDANNSFLIGLGASFR